MDISHKPAYSTNCGVKGNELSLAKVNGSGFSLKLKLTPRPNTGNEEGMTALDSTIKPAFYVRKKSEQPSNRKLPTV